MLVRQRDCEGGRDYCAEHGIPVRPEVIASALLDHDIRSDPYGYGDLNTLRGRERLSRHGAQIAWEMLATERGARMTRNAAAYRAAVQKREILKAELDRRNREIATAVEQARAAGKVPADLLLDLLANDERADLQARIAATENEIHKLLDDPDKLIPVPDSWSEEQLRADVEAFEKAITSTPTRPKPRAQRQPNPVRDWVTIGELANRTRRLISDRRALGTRRAPPAPRRRPTQPLAAGQHPRRHLSRRAQPAHLDRRHQPSRHSH